VRLLLDTHIAVWALLDADRLPAQARQLIADEANDVSVSAASVWEIAIKHASRRPAPSGMPISGEQAVGLFRKAGYNLLSITPAHAAAVEGLPPLHADPFDRLLVAQALIGPMRLVTHDKALAAYGDIVLQV
jgi:PIN domain nuclease of toxin-antitoxin system